MTNIVDTTKLRDVVNRLLPAEQGFKNRHQGLDDIESLLVRLRVLVGPFSERIKRRILECFQIDKHVDSASNV